MQDTYSNLVKENELLKAQIAVLRDRFPERRVLRSEIQGTRPGDQLICDEQNFEAALAAFVEPCETVVEIYAVRPRLRWLRPRVLVLLVPDPERAAGMAAASPSELVVTGTAHQFLSTLADRSVDCVVIRDLLRDDEHAGARGPATPRNYPDLSAEDVLHLLSEAHRVTRRHVVVLCRLEHPRRLPDALGAFRQSLWCSADPANAIVVINTGDPDSCSVREFAVIAGGGAGTTKDRLRLVVLSAAPPEHFRWSSNDVVVCDIDIAAESGHLPVAGIIPVPLKLLRTAMDQPSELLRSSILNFAYLEQYLQCMPAVTPIGTNAEFVVAEMRSRMAECASTVSAATTAEADRTESPRETGHSETLSRTGP